MALWQRRGCASTSSSTTQTTASSTSRSATPSDSTQAGLERSVGSRGDSYDNALAESTIGLYKTELIHRRGPWRTIDDVEIATLEYVDWFNHRRLHGEIGMIPPAELVLPDLGGRKLSDISTVDLQLLV